MDEVWESGYLDAYDKVLLNTDIYRMVMGFHIDAMVGCRAVLDSGCGTGNVTLGLLKRGCMVSALDPSSKAIGILRAKCTGYENRLRTYNIGAEQLPFEDRFFDGVTSMFVVHFMDDFEGYLREHYRVLKDNGLFALTGRVSGENMELVVQSYEGSLRRRGLLPMLEPEMRIIRENITGSVRKAVRHKYAAADVETMLRDIGFNEVAAVPNPYFGQCYSLLAKK